MRKSFRVILDCDDVLYYCNATAVRKINAIFGTKFTLQDITSWGPLGNELDHRLEFFKDPGFMGDLAPCEGAKEFVSALARRAEIFIATNVHAQCAGARVEAIIRDFPEIDPANILIGGRKDLLQADMLLDDAAHNFESARVNYPVLFRQPWNHSKSGVLAVSNYDEFLALVDLIKDIQSDVEKADDRIVTLVGPSGAGMKLVASRYVEEGYTKVRSYTTRPADNECDRYIHLTREEFLKLLMEGFFFETSVYMGDYYGLHAGDIQDVLSQGGKALLIMDINGAIAVKRHFHGTTVFVKGSKETCIQNILQSTASQEEKIRRLVALDDEFGNEAFCDLTVAAD